MRMQPSHASRSQGSQCKDGEGQPEQCYHGCVKLTHAVAIQIAMIETEKGGKSGSHIQ